MSTAAGLLVDQTVVNHAGILDYQVAWQLQRDTLEGVVAGTTPNTLILLQHPSVYTAGRMTKLDERPVDGTPVIDVDRGGKITWHGLGQIVGYPIVKLKNRNDVVGFVREVETALIDVCLQFGIAAERYCERSGVWIRDEKGDRKIAAIGMRVAKGVTMHGFALNVNPDLTAYEKIVPCGISDADVTSMQQELGRDISIDEVLPLVEEKILAALTKGDFMSLAPEGRKLLRIEARNAAVPIERKPEWIKTRANMGPEYTKLRSLVVREGLHTVCQEAACPNIFECWEDREATFLIGGERCTRRCDFCNIDTGKPEPLDRDEPRRVAESVRSMELRYATITGVTRDDLPDEGAWLYAETIRAVHELNPGTGVEILTPDFSGKPHLLNEVFETRPEVFAHNLETVPRIFKEIRPAFRYDRSLDVISQAQAFGLVTKSNLILGMGETREEVTQALIDLRAAGCDLITITQYLRPTPKHHPVVRWVKPEEFVELSHEAEEIGFLGVMSGPLVRSSFRAGRLYKQAEEKKALLRG